MKRRLMASVGAAAALLFLGGCGGSSRDEPAASEPAAAAESTETATADDPVTVACGLFANGGDYSLQSRVFPAITDIDGELSIEKYAELASVHRALVDLIEKAPPGLAEVITSMDDPFAQIVDSTGTVTFEPDYAGDVSSDVLDAMQWCADAGFVFETAD